MAIQTAVKVYFQSGLEHQTRYQGDVLPDLYLKAVEDDGSVCDLTGATVALTLVDNTGRTIVSASACVVDTAASGLFHYVMTAAVADDMVAPCRVRLSVRITLGGVTTRQINDPYIQVLKPV